MPLMIPRPAAQIFQHLLASFPLAAALLAACQSPRLPVGAVAPGVSISIFDAAASWDERLRETTIVCDAAIENATASPLYAQSSGYSPFDGFEIHVMSEGGAPILQAPHLRRDDPSTPEPRTFLLPPGLTRRRLAFPRIPHGRDGERMTIRLVGGLAGTAYPSDLKSNVLTVTVTSAPPESPAPPAPESPSPAPPEAEPDRPRAPAAPSRQEPATGDGDAAAPPEGGVPDRLSQGPGIAAFYVPVIGLYTDLDASGLRQKGSLGDADVEAGFGWGGRVSFGDIDERDDRILDAGLLYLHTEHRERLTNAKVVSESAYLEGIWTWRLFEGPIQLTGCIGLGAGGILIAMPYRFHDTGGAAIEGCALVGMRLFEHVELRSGLSLFFWGFPGETLGSGFWVPLEGAVTF